MCPAYNGIGSRLTMDPGKIVPDENLSISEGAMIPWRGYFARGNKKQPANSWGGRQLNALKRQYGIDFNRPWKKLPKKHRDIILYGSGGKEMVVAWESEKIQGTFRTAWEGQIPTMMRRYRQTQSEHQKKYYAAFMSEKPCTVCHGGRLRTDNGRRPAGGGGPG